jgi:hypothetical protein
MIVARPSPVDLRAIARQIVVEHGFEPDFHDGVPQQFAPIKAKAPAVTSVVNRRPQQISQIADA